jgi:hypothetical protein
VLRACRSLEVTANSSAPAGGPVLQYLVKYLCVSKKYNCAFHNFSCVIRCWFPNPFSQVARGYGKLLASGWQPRRTILLLNWDAEEYGLIGSTEWVEDNADLLRNRGVAYLNVDSAVMRGSFFAAASPQLDETVRSVTKEVPEPDHPGESIFDVWNGTEVGG